jgi:uncharacterized membrane protein
MLIYFLYHLSEIVQAPNVIAAVSHDLDRTIDHLARDTRRVERPADGDGEAAVLPSEFARDARCLASRRTGYVQEIDENTLLALCRRQDLLIRVEHRPGDFIVQGHRLALVWPDGRGDSAIERRILNAIAIGQQRTIAQYVEFSANQLVQVALQALSLGHNRIAEQWPRNAARYDHDGQLRLMIRPITFAELVESAFGQIREFGRSSAASCCPMRKLLFC